MYYSWQRIAAYKYRMDYYLMESRYLVIYDIADNRRIAKTASLLLDYGVRIQRSVFEVMLHEESLAYLKQRLQDILDPDKDGVKIFRLCESCSSRICGIGVNVHLQNSPSYVIV